MSDADRQKWDARYAQPAAAPRDPEPFLLELDHLLPRSGRALDVAGGAGRNAIWLARRGLDVTLVDISAVGRTMPERRRRKLAYRSKQSRPTWMSIHCPRVHGT
jgi:2-polyprenyl-3-methyl-5-hydroxy-6-metoxy-1,4-benzoquinol methylase